MGEAFGHAYTAFSKPLVFALSAKNGTHFARIKQCFSFVSSAYDVGYS